MSFNIENIKKAFASVGVGLTVPPKPFARAIDADDIFQLDIRRKFKGVARSEYFLMWPGHVDNTIHITCTDENLGQLVMSVKEPKREFWVRLDETAQRQIKKYGIKSLSERRPDDRRGILLDPKQSYKQFGGDGWYVWRSTPDRTRHYLLGRDERQLFMCQLTRAATNMKQAHESLKAPQVVTAEGKALGRTLRQGEWFFLNVTVPEQEAIEKYLRSSLAIVHKKANIGVFAGRAAGKPHTVDELIVMRGELLEHGFPTRQRDEVFVRGNVRHSDHSTITMRSWRKVILNQEQRAAGDRTFSAGTTWID